MRLKIDQSILNSELWQSSLNTGWWNEAIGSTLACKTASYIRSTNGATFSIIRPVLMPLIFAMWQYFPLYFTFIIIMVTDKRYINKVYLFFRH